MKVKRCLWIIIALFCCSILRGQSVGLVLSGGGAKGLSHVGVIKALEEYNIPIDYICGTSMGAIVGGLYAAGFTPDEMLEIFRSAEFEAWYRGEQEKGFASYFYRDEADASMISFDIIRKDEDERMWTNPFEVKRKPHLKVDLPTSIVSPYFMDMALIEVFGPASVVAGDNFDSLMVPFFCVAADIKNKEPLVIKSGNLGSAVRASMSYPLVFRPITIDSTLLFDGGFYNNFPWKIMAKEYNPDFIIGAKCVVGNTAIDEDDIVTHVSNMLTSATDYQIPEEKGVVIERKYPYGLMDFHKADEIVEMGYENALLYIGAIKERVQKERTPKEVSAMRNAFRSREKELKFSPEIEIAGDLKKSARSFVVKGLTGGEEAVQSLDGIKKGYYRIVATDRFKTLFPSYEIKNDSLLTLNIRATKAAGWRVSIGGNISSSSHNQAFVGATYSHLSENPWKIGIGMNVGKYYKGGYISWRHDIGMHPMMYYRTEFVAQQFGYSGVYGKVRQFEYYGLGEFVLPVAIDRNIFFKMGFTVGRGGVADKTSFTLFSPVLGLVRNTLDYPLYPVSGRKEQILLKYNYAPESFNPGFFFQAKSEAYFKISEKISLGYIADLVISKRNRVGDYVTTMLCTPAFRPVPHSNIVMMEEYRADSYLGVGISPVILFSNLLFLHCNISWFQPYEVIVKSDDGRYHYLGTFPKGAIVSNAALVWRSPVGPVSLSATYYERGKSKWYPQLNIGFLIFKKRVLEF